MITHLNTYLPEMVEPAESYRETNDTFSILFDRVNTGRSGQFFMLSSPGVGEAPISTSSGNGRNLLFTIREVGSVTSALRKGGKIGLRGPYGNFWPWREFEEILAIAGGIGIPPVRALIEEMVDEGRADDLEIAYGARAPPDIVYKREISGWRNEIRFLQSVDVQSADWNGHVGFVTDLIKNSTVTRKAAVFVIGPPLMMKNSVKEALANGFREDRIFISLERRMECGIGVCGHCNVGELYVCEDGPIFSYSRMKGYPELFL